MFEPNTVFVIGAGASAEFGLPVGWKLLETIRDNSHFEFEYFNFPSKGNEKIFKAVQVKYGADHELLNQALTTFKDIKKGVETAGSIDEYINRYGDDSMIAELGKILIAHSILDAEGKSKLMPQRGKERDGVDWSKTSDTWIASFTRALFDGVRATEVERIGEGLTIICFNYDRCIEYYLEHAIMRAYRNVDKHTARMIVSKMNIIHPYGWLGDLNFKFGTLLEDADIYRVSKNLITWSETTEDADKVSAIKSAIFDAENIIFLGFAFANQNMKILKNQDAVPRGHAKNVYATGYGLTNDIEEKLKGKIAALFGPNIANSVTQYERIRIKYGMICTEFMEKQLLNFTV